MKMQPNTELPLDAIAWYEWESEEADSNWLLTYVDMLSVLLAMLVVLLGHMAVQRMQTPAAAVKPHTVAQQVTRKAAVPEAVERQPEPEPAAMPEVRQQEPAVARASDATAQPVDEIQATKREPQPEAPAETSSQSRAESTPEARLATAIESQFKGEIKVVQRDHGISLEISEVILFESGKADLLPEAGPVLAHLASTLQEIGDTAIAVEGHTDNRPILGGRFRSNWELAAARANAVTQFLLGRGFAPERLRSVSYADTRPLADNATAAGRAQNRRVNLRVDFL